MARIPSTEFPVKFISPLGSTMQVGFPEVEALSISGLVGVILQICEITNSTGFRFATISTIGPFCSFQIVRYDTCKPHSLIVTDGAEYF